MNSARWVRWVVSAGAVAVVLAATPYRAFDLDRFFAPKELVLSVAAFAASIAALRRAPALALTRVDTLLAAYVALSGVSALLASNHWLATRAFTLTLGGAALFWAARVGADSGYGRAIVAGCAFAAVIGAATSLAQAYGMTSDYFSLNRAPGGTFGNRNFMAHLAAIGTPALVFTAITARRGWTAMLGAAGIGIITAALVLSRTRAAWLALAAGVALLAYGLWRAHRKWSDARSASRMRIVALAAAGGVLAALLLPNTLEWRSDSPYLDTVAGVVNYREGSGRGRVIQYTNSLRIAGAHPLFGVGPGNWAVEYPRVASHNDPSLDTDDGMTSNPWPSSDWVAIASERGVPASIAITLVFLGLGVGAWRRVGRAGNAVEYLEGLALATTLLVVVVVGAFDAVLLLPAPAFVAWALFGALAAPSAVRTTIPLAPRRRRRWMGAVTAVALVAIAREGAQLGAMVLFSAALSISQIEWAARLDPGSYRIQMKLAATYAARGDCDRARIAAGSARSLFPNAPDPRRLIRDCSDRGPAPR